MKSNVPLKVNRQQVGSVINRGRVVRFERFAGIVRNLLLTTGFLSEVLAHQVAGPFAKCLVRGFFNG